MTTPAILANHDHISEREADGTWEDCTWCGGLMWYRVTQDPSKPATHAEAEALRKASGEPATGGSNQGNFRAGVKARYGKSLPPAISGFNALWAALTPSTAATIQGSMSVFGPNHPLSKYDRNFDGAHDVFVARVDDQDRVWWDDPEAPDTGPAGYNGVWVTKAELKQFVDAFGGQHIVAPIIHAQEDSMPNLALTAYKPGTKVAVKAASNVRADSKITAAKYRTTAAVEAQTIIGTVKGDVDPKNGKDTWYVWWANGRYEYTALDNVASETAPGSADCSQAVAAAVKPLNDKISAQAQQIASQSGTISSLQGQVAASEAARASAATTERERIAQAEAARIRGI